MKIEKALKRDNKRLRRKYGHVVDGRSVKLLHDIQRKKSIEIKKEREEHMKIMETLSNAS
jgi:hypothetical protein